MRTVVAKWQAMGFRVASVNVLSLALVISALWFLGNPDQVHACKCAVPGSPSEEFEKFFCSLRRESHLDPSLL